MKTQSRNPENCRLPISDLGSELRSKTEAQSTASLKNLTSAPARRYMRRYSWPLRLAEAELEMRIKLTLKAVANRTDLPLNYQHAVASMIYNRLAASSSNFAAKIHDVGFRANGRTFKLFTFSRLQTRKSRVLGDRLSLDDHEVWLQISSPVAVFIEHLITGLSKAGEVRIENAQFQVTRIEELTPPTFYDQMKFQALSPITETTNGNREHPTFLTLADDWSQVMKRNLSDKYQALFGRPPSDASLKWTWDQNYVRKREAAGWRLSVLADIRGIKVRGWLMPFMVEGSRELIEIGYESGFGARNSMGFGMAEAN